MMTWPKTIRIHFSESEIGIRWLVFRGLYFNTCWSLFFFFLKRRFKNLGTVLQFSSSTLTKLLSKNNNNNRKPQKQITKKHSNKQRETQVRISWIPNTFLFSILVAFWVLNIFCPFASLNIQIKALLLLNSCWFLVFTNNVNTESMPHMSAVLAKINYLCKCSCENFYHSRSHSILSQNPLNPWILKVTDWHRK